MEPISKKDAKNAVASLRMWKQRKQRELKEAESKSRMFGRDGRTITREEGLKEKIREIESSIKYFEGLS